MDLGLNGRVAIVTGGGGPGNGGHIARTLAREGATVVIVDLSKENGEARASEIREAGGTALPLVANAASWPDVQGVVAEALRSFGRIDVLVNSAAGANNKLFIESSPEDWPRDIDGCLVAALNCSRAVLEPMRDAGWGRIVNIISDAGRVGEVRQSVYSGAKAGIIGFSRALAKEVGRYGITVNNVSPAVTEREDATLGAWYWGATPEEQQRRRERAMRAYPLAAAYHRFGRPQDVANAVAFFCSEAAMWVTGQTLSVNGGYSMI
ncbi:MAG TPA: SDR family oxidoreductase [Dehalococcoidia bacterium]|nr:SDR family oxidoreductase [Dehalococcoidia bacterium]